MDILKLCIAVVFHPSGSYTPIIKTSPTAKLFIHKQVQALV